VVTGPGAGLDRRGFLALLVSAAAGATVVAGCSDDEDAEPHTVPTSPTAPTAPSTLTDALVVLAAAVRDVAPDLEPLELGIDPADPDALAAAVADLDEAAAGDLADGSVVVATGWILSVTEARLALAVAP
jgi:hypothetical protein